MLLDDERNDIYIHIGMDVKFEREEFKGVVKKLCFAFLWRACVNSGGGYSQIRSELILFQSAWEHGYEYYHLISGVDLPIKTQDEIHEFFREHYGKEFIYFCPKRFGRNPDIKYEQYYWLQEKIGREGHGFLRFVEKYHCFCRGELA